MSASNLYPSGTSVENFSNLEVISAISGTGFGTLSPATTVARLEIGKGFNTCYIMLPANSCTVSAQQPITITLANNSLFALDPAVPNFQSMGYCRFRNDVSGVVQMVGVRLQTTAGGIQIRTDDITLTNTNAYTCALLIQYPRA